MTASPLSPSAPQLNASVMASAGTGKTWLLVTRLVRLLLAGASPGAILAITFTRKAANEMQSRLLERLERLAACTEEGLDEQLREMAIEPTPSVRAEARALYERLLRTSQPLRTTTFHAFCQEILRRFPLEADVPPGFELLEQEGEIAGEALDALLEEANDGPAGDTATALTTMLQFFGGNDGLLTALKAFLAHRSDWWAMTQPWSQPVAQATAQLASQLQVDPTIDPLGHFFAHYTAAIEEYIGLLGRHPVQQHKVAMAALRRALDEASPPTSRFAAVGEAMLKSDGARRLIKRSATLEKKLGGAATDRLLELNGELGEAFAFSHEQFKRKRLIEVNHACYLAGARLIERYQQVKRERRLLDFADLEWQSYRLLSEGENAHWVQYKLDQRIDHLLVDEFQDTNPTQWRLLLPLLQEMAASAERPRSIFLVGDQKQSIYRFRRAQPALFDEAAHWLEERMAAHRFPLHTSWRSAPLIMEVVNRLFDADGPMAGLLANFTPHATNLAHLWGRVTLLPAASGDTPAEGQPLEFRNPLERPREPAGASAHQNEGKLIATTIRELIDEGAVVHHGPAARAVSYRDIIILVRKRTHVHEYERALLEEGIPYISADRGTLLETLEARDMVALLTFLTAPFNNLALATLLRSPLFSCSEEDLLQLARGGEGDWYLRLEQLAARGENERLSYAFAKMASWRLLADRLPIHDLLDHIYHQGNVIERYRAAYPPHLKDRVQANLGRFLELALAIDSGRYPSLGHFVAQLEALRDNKLEAPSEGGSTGEDRVRIMTIHAAKGLEAPVIFLADSAADEGGSGQSSHTLLDWPVEAEAPTLFYTTGKKEQQSELCRRWFDKEGREQRRESANLLYVAVTRARQLLYLSAATGKRTRLEQSWYGRIREALAPGGETPADEPLILASGTMPAAATAAPPPAAEVVEPQLRQRLCMPPPPGGERQMIAPSRHDAEAGGLGLEYSSAESAAGRERGTALHRLLELMVREPRLGESGLKQRLVATLPRDLSNTHFAELYREARATLELTELSRRLHEEGVELRCEQPLQFRQGDDIVYGIIDLLIIAPERVTIIDYKSHRLAEQNGYAQLAEALAPQLALYRDGIARLFPERTIEAYLCFTAPGILHQVL